MDEQRIGLPTWAGHSRRGLPESFGRVTDQRYRSEHSADDERAHADRAGAAGHSGIHVRDLRDRKPYSLSCLVACRTTDQGVTRHEPRVFQRVARRIARGNLYPPGKRTRSQFRHRNRLPPDTRCDEEDDARHAEANGTACDARRGVQRTMSQPHPQRDSSRILFHRSVRCSAVVRSIRVAIVHTWPAGSMIQAVRSPQN